MNRRITVAAMAVGMSVLTGTGAMAATGTGHDATGSGGPPRITVARPQGPPGSPAAGTATAAHQRPLRATVTLLTGDRVRLDAAIDGSQDVEVLPAGGTGAGGTAPATATYTRFSSHGDQYVVPNEAVPYLGSTLDARLFDVSYLVRAKLDDAHSQSLPVTLTSLTAGADLPGLRVIRRTGSTATGTLARDRAAALGHRLVSGWRAAASTRAAGSVGRLPGVGRIDLAPPAGAPAAPAPLLSTATESNAPSAPAGSAGTTRSAVVSPQAASGGGGSGVPYHTLTINAVNRAGAPGTVLGFLRDVDDPTIPTVEIVASGTTTLSVPEGTYSLMTVIVEGPADDYTVPATLAVNPQFDVTADRSVTVDARTGVPYQATVDPAPDAPARTDILTFARTDGQGHQFSLEGSGGSAIFVLGFHLASSPDRFAFPLYATPTQPTMKGHFSFDAYTQYAQPWATPSNQPRYAMTFPSPDGIPASLTYSVPLAQFAALHQTLYNQPCGSSCVTPNLSYDMFLPWAENRVGASQVLPGAHTDYLYSSAPDITLWQAFANTSESVRLYGQRRFLAPGQEISEDWNKGPLVPASAAPYLSTDVLDLSGLGAPPPTTGATALTDRFRSVCPACRQDDLGMLFIPRMGDSDPSHFSAPDAYWEPETINYYRNGTLTMSSDATETGLDVGLPFPFSKATPMLRSDGTYRLDWVDPAYVDGATSTGLDWTYHSGPADPAAALPKGVECAPDPSRSCTYLPLLFPHYDLALDADQRARAAAPFGIDFTVGYQNGQPAPTGVSATVAVSYDDGATWSAPRDATGLGGDRFHLAIDHPALTDTSGFVSLRVTARDGAGNSVTQTMIRAYALTD